MKINQYISKGLFALGCLSFAACSSEDESATSNVSPVLSNGKMQVTASMSDDNVTRTSYNNNNVSWSGSDAIWIYNSNKHNNVVQYGSFTIETLKNEKEAIFTGNAISYKEKATDGENQMYALYPAPTNGGASTIVTSNGTTTLSTELPAVQTAVDGSFDPKAHIMTAHSTNTTFYFNNLVTLVKVTVGDTGPFNVHAVRLTANKPLAGQFTATINADGTTQNVTVSAGSNSVVIEKNNNGTFTKLNGDYYIAVLPGSLSEGFTIQFEDLTSGDEKIYQRKVKAGTNSDAGKVIKIGTYSTATDGYKIGDVNTGLPISATAGATALYTNGVIDLGLPSGTLWATRNIAAGKDNLFVDNVYDYGQYYAWGEDFGFDETPNTTEGQYTNINTSYTNMSAIVSGTRYRTKIKYEWNTYKWSSYTKNGLIYTNRTVGKYNSTDGLTELTGWVSSSNKGDDIAQIKSQGKYEMPTKAQFDELTSTNNTSMDNQCRSSILTNRSKYGINYTSKIVGYTSRSIWLPAAGATYGDSDVSDLVNKNGHKHNVDERLAYWTKTLVASDVDQAYCYDYGSSEFLQSSQTVRNGYDRRYAGRNIRPVVKR